MDELNKVIERWVGSEEPIKLVLMARFEDPADMGTFADFISEPFRYKNHGSPAIHMAHIPWSRVSNEGSIVFFVTRNSRSPEIKNLCVDRARAKFPGVTCCLMVPAAVPDLRANHF